MSEHLSQEEFDQMRSLIRRFAEDEMDQWAAWRTETKFGTVYITIARVPAQGATDEGYDPF